MSPAVRPPRRRRVRARLRVGVAVAAVAALAACAPGGAPANIPVAQGSGLTVQVVDSLNDAGRTPSLAIDARGSPVVAYQLLKPAPQAGALPPPIIAGAPQPPSVMLATQSSGSWQRTAVTGGVGVGQKAQGDATEIANKDFEALPGVNTALAVDGSGHHYVAWATPTGAFVANDVSGSFSAKQQVTSAAASGISIAVAADGTPWVSYFEGGSVKAASGAGGSWKAETVGTATPPTGFAGAPTAIAVGPNGPVIAYGDGTTTVVATRSASGSWTTSPITGAGGFGVSMALDKSGNPVVSYYDQAANVIVATGQGAAQLQPQTIATVTRASSGTVGPSAQWGTGTAVDGQGNVYVTWADTTLHRIFFASNSGGAFRVRPVAESSGGITPAIAVEPAGKVLAIGWYDSINQNLVVATTSSGQLALAFSPLPQRAPTPGPSTTGPACAPSGSSTAIAVAAPTGASASGFDKKCLAVAAGKAFTVTFSNDDTGVPHNWALFSDAAATQRVGGAPSPGDIVAAGSKQTYNLKALQAGTYYFHCDIHPTTMNGTFVVAGK